MSDSQDPPPRRPDPEGVRIIGADEAEAALEREDVARRRSPEDPRPGDRPGTPPEDAPEPVLRFPLSADEARPSGPGAGGSHWAEPGAGDYGTSGGNIFDEPAETEIEAGWSAFSAGPRWRDRETGDDWGGTEADPHYGDEPTGAMPAGEGVPRDPEDFFSFDEMQDPAASASVFDEGGYDDPQAGYYDEAEGYGDGYGPEGEAAYGDDDDRRIVVGGGRVTPGGPRTRVPAAPPEGTDRDIGQAAVVGGALFIVALVLFAIGPWAALLLVTAAVTFAAVEFFTKLREIGHDPAAFLGVVASGMLVIGAYHRGTDAIAVGMFLVIVATMVWFLIGAGEENAVHNMGLTVLGVAWIGMLGAFGGAILAVQGGPGIGNAGNGILFGAILATIAYDLGGWFIGRNAGSRPLSQASPNKTVEGLVGGCIAALAVAIVYGTFVEPFGGPGAGFKLGLAVAVAAPLGDLCQSLIKRDLGIKDMASVLPGHGGFTDRFDGMLFVLPTVYFVARLSDFFL